MKHLFVVILLLNISLFRSNAQDTIITMSSTYEIVDFCLRNGGDAAINRFDCSYLALIDTSACMKILDNINWSYSKKPVFNFKRNNRKENDYAQHFQTYRHFILNSGEVLKNTKLLKSIIEIFNVDINDTISKYEMELSDKEIHPLILQISNSEMDSILICFADKWLMKSMKYDKNGFSPLKRDMSVIFTGNYPQKLENYIACRLNEITLLKAYNYCTKENNNLINSRINKIISVLNKLTDRNFDQNFSYQNSSFLSNIDNEIPKEYAPDYEIKCLEQFQGRNFIENNLGTGWNSVSLNLIYSGSIGILNSQVNSIKSAESMGYLIKLTKENKIKLYNLYREFIN